MRLALVVERFSPHGGGIERAVWSLAAALAGDEDEIHVLAREGRDAPGVTLHRLPAPTFWQPVRVLRFVQQARDAVAAGGFDLVHAFTRALHCDVMHAGGGSHAHFMQHTYGAGPARLRRLSPRHAVALALERRIYADPELVVQCVSEMVRDELAQRFSLPRERTPVIPYGVDTDLFARKRWEDTRDALRERTAAGDATVWLFAGTGWRRKGLDTALAALARSHDRRSQLWVAGGDAPGLWRGRVRDLGLEGRVSFLGARDDLERYYVAADGLLFPSRYDPFGMACLEAASCERPCVLSGRTGAAEVVAEGACVVADPEDVAGFAAALDLLADPEAREERGRAGRAIATAHTWAHCAERMRALYARVRTERRPA